MYYIKKGIKYMRIQFYVEGTRRRGTVFAEVKEVSMLIQFANETFFIISNFNYRMNLAIMNIHICTLW